jgi:hypothetical protein
MKTTKRNLQERWEGKSRSKSLFMGIRRRARDRSGSGTILAEREEHKLVGNEGKVPSSQPKCHPHGDPSVISSLKSPPDSPEQG